MSLVSISTTLSSDDLACLESQWNGGCVLSVHDCGYADAWIDANYDHKCVVALRENNIGGPIASMLSVKSAALAIFGTISAPLIQMAEELAEISGLPIMIRPFGEDPSPRFK
jgi:hypothetical protein